MTPPHAPYHAHIYYDADSRDAALSLHRQMMAVWRRDAPDPVVFVGAMRDRAIGPHPAPQFEVHFHERSLSAMLARIRVSGLSALVHPLTDDDLADHTTLATWIGPAMALDLSVLDPPGVNQGLARFGKTDV